MYLGGGSSGYPRKGKRRVYGYVAIAAVAAIALWYVTSGRLAAVVHAHAATVAYEEKDYARASQELLATEKARTGRRLVFEGRAAVALAQGRLEDAQAAYLAANGSTGSSGRFDAARIGRAYLDAGDYGKAAVALRYAASLLTAPADAFVGLGECELCALHFEAATQLFTKALALDKGNARAQKGLQISGEARERGSLYYVYDRNGAPLAKIGPNGEAGYPAGYYLCQLVGFRDARRGRMGIEAAYADVLPGNSLRLTIDLGLQKAAIRALGWYKGAIIVLDPQTGEVLAAASQPVYEPNQVDKSWRKIVDNVNRPLLNRCFELAVEPGSICKAITAAAAIEEHVHLEKIFPLRCVGSVYVDGKPFYDWKPHHHVRDLAEAFDDSCNVGFAYVGWALGADKLYQYDNRFGFNAKIPFDMPLLTSTAPLTAEDRTDIAERATGLGKGFRITPLHAAMLVASIANDGVMMRPHVIAEVRNVLGEPIRTVTPEVFRNCMQPATARQLRAMMLETVEKGIGKKARAPGITVAGKTGTSGSRKTGLNAWFICFAPAEDPHYAIAILAEGGGMGMDVAAPMAKKLLEELAARRAAS